MKTAAKISLCLAMTAAATGCDQEQFAAEQEALDFRIVNGGPTNGDPAVAYLVMYNQEQQPFSECTGTLIASKWVLTAAHCISNAAFGNNEVAGIAVYFGTDALQQQDPGFVHLGQAVSATAHEAWDPAGAPDQGNDMALIELAEAPPVEPIPINRSSMADNWIGAPIRLVGWGITGGGQQDSGIKRAVDSQLFGFNEQLISVGSPQSNTCSGDSGGPAFMNVDGQTVVAGVTSFGDVNCQQDGYSMRVDAFAGWIDGVMGNPGAGGNGGGGNGGGGACTSGEECPGGICVDGGNGGFCSEQCNTDNDCPDNWACFSTDDPNLNVCAPDGDGGGEGGGEGGGDDGGGVDKPGLGGGKDSGGDDGGGGGGGGGGYYQDDEEDESGCTVGATKPTPLALGLLILGFVARRKRSR